MKTNPFTLTFLGTGTSQGVPVIGCDCPVCRSDDPRDRRLRTAAMLDTGQSQIVIDVGPDFRQQMLRAGAANVRAVLLTHEHNDHIIGLDDLRPFNFLQWRNMPIYASERVCENVRHRFAYIFAAEKYPGAPLLELRAIDKDEPLLLEGLPVQPIEVMHGKLPVLGFRIGALTYLTDMKTIADEELEKVAGSRILVVNALHHNPHQTHLNLEEALAFVERVRPEQAYLLHCSHRMGLHAEVSAELPENVFLAYDGLQLKIE